jgi:DNA-binding response OmpR family regulator
VRIAVVEDHPDVADLVRSALDAAGLGADVFETAACARTWLKRSEYAALILGRGLPDGDGLHLLAELRGGGWAVPCLVLTARDALHDRVAGLDHGADDYLAKPFALAELVARVRAILRRRERNTPLVSVVGNVRIDAGAATVLVGGARLCVSPTEYRVLLALAEAEGRMRSPTQVIDSAHGPFAAVSRNGLEVVVHRLRARLAAAGATAAIVNQRGVGYALVPDVAAAQPARSPVA